MTAASESSPCVRECVDRAREALATGSLDRAARLGAEAVRIEPACADAWHVLGLLASHTGEWSLATEALHRAVELAPLEASFHSDLAVVLRRSDRIADARAELRRALDLDPRCAPAHHNLARLERDQGAFRDAIAAYRGAVEADPGLVAAWSGLGACLASLDRHDEALEALEEAVRHNPGDRRLSAELAGVREALEWRRIGRASPSEAVPLLEAALARHPDDPLLHCQRGAVLRLAGRRAESIARLRVVAHRWPDCADAWNELGGSLQEVASICGDERLLDEADGSLARAVELAPERWSLAFNLALLRLSRGDLVRGFAGYEARWRDGRERLAAYPRPLWHGEPLGGRTILLHAEQGLGDTLQFVRYAALVRERGGRVLLQCQKPLRTLLGGCKAVERVIDDEMPVPAFDVHAPLLSLPGLFATTLETIPADVPYLLPDPELVAAWRERLRQHRGMRIGIAWQGNRDFLRDRWRSVPLACFEPLARIPGVELFSLQYGFGREQLAELGPRWNIPDLGLAFEEAAALMLSLDLVVTIDTSIAHLAGALGRPVWLALSSTPDWRWLLRRPDSPWYPTMRLFRQRSPGDWAGVFQAMAVELALHAKRA